MPATSVRQRLVVFVFCYAMLSSMIPMLSLVKSVESCFDRRTWPCTRHTAEQGNHQNKKSLTDINVSNVGSFLHRKLAWIGIPPSTQESVALNANIVAWNSTRIMPGIDMLNFILRTGSIEMWSNIMWRSRKGGMDGSMHSSQGHVTQRWLLVQVCIGLLGVSIRLGGQSIGPLQVCAKYGVFFGHFLEDM